MGSPPLEKYRQSDEDQVSVEITKPYEIMATEVTQKQWFQVMRTNPSYFKREEDCDNYDNMNKMCPDNPVERVSWKDVQLFIKKLNRTIGLKGCKGSPSDPIGCYRLPTEAEWEWATRSKTKTAYFFGDNSSTLEKYVWQWNNSGKRTHKVGIKAPNPLGLHDVYGNVWEWVQDAYQSKLPGGRDPLVTHGSSRVLRGGGWHCGSKVLRSAYRYHDSPYSKSMIIGFRLVKTL